MPRIPPDQVGPYGSPSRKVEPKVAPATATRDRDRAEQRATSQARMYGEENATAADDANEKFLPAKQVRQRYGDASDMWLWRRLRDGSDFPRPVEIAGRRFWRLSALVRWERARARGAA